MTTYKYDDSGTQLVEERRYSVIPNSGEGAGWHQLRFDVLRLRQHGPSLANQGSQRDDPPDGVRCPRSDDRQLHRYKRPQLLGRVRCTDNMVKTENLVYDGGSGAETTC